MKSLKSWTKKDREKVPMNNIELTKSLIRLPMEFWGDSMVNWKGMSLRFVDYLLDYLFDDMHLVQERSKTLTF